MRRTIKRLLTGLLIFGLIPMFAGLAVGGGDVTIIGTINEDNQIVDNAGVVYELADNEMSEELAEHVGQKLEVKGTVMEGGDGKMITITSYKVVEE
jgi:hypothetical protein